MLLFVVFSGMIGERREVRSVNTYEVVGEIVIKLIEKDGIQMSQFPEADTYVDAVCEAYKKIFNAVNKPTI